MRTRAFKDKIESLITDLLKTFNATIFPKENNHTDRFIRAILPPLIQINHRDQINYGVAFKVHKNNKIEVGPYLYRIVCENGAVVNNEIFNQELSVNGLMDFEIKAKLLDAIDECCSLTAYKYAQKNILESTKVPANLRLIFNRLAHFTQWDQRTSVYNHIIRRLDMEEQPTKYDLLNAITSLARDTIDPELKWNLQKLGWDAVTGVGSNWIGNNKLTTKNNVTILESNPKTSG
jgi:hypothetical protein